MYVRGFFQIVKLFCVHSSPFDEWVFESEKFRDLQHLRHLQRTVRS